MRCRAMLAAIKQVVRVPGQQPSPQPSLPRTSEDKPPKTVRSPHYGFFKGISSIYISLADPFSARLREGLEPTLDPPGRPPATPDLDRTGGRGLGGATSCASTTSGDDPAHPLPPGEVCDRLVRSRLRPPVHRVAAAPPLSPPEGPAPRCPQYTAALRPGLYAEASPGAQSRQRV